MDIYAHFGLTQAPFIEAVDSEACLASPLHREALATLRYAVRDHKACAMVIGSCGMGRTLVGRLARKACQNRRPALWVHGLSQSDNSLAATVLTTSEKATRSPADFETTTLADWFATNPRGRVAPVIIVDEADELTSANWDELIGLMAQDMRFERQLTVILLGTPMLRERLAAPELARMRRRVFRICSLLPMTVEQSLEYIGARIAHAGGDVTELFEQEALEKIARLTRGNPSLINVLCDNALIEAFGVDRKRITLDDVRSAVEAMIGITRTATDEHLLPRPDDVTLALPVATPAPETTTAATETVIAATTTQATSRPTDTSSFERRMDAMRARLKRTLSAVRDVGRHIDEATAPESCGAGETTDVVDEQTPEEIVVTAS